MPTLASKADQNSASMKPAARPVQDARTDDHVNESVPLSERRGPVTLGLLWLTMMCGFPTVLIGFEWEKAGLTMPQVLQAIGLSCAFLLLYMLPACYLGARTGLTYSLLSRQIFGRWGSRLVSFNLIWVSIAWYGLTANFLADGLKGIYHLPWPTWILGAALAILMAFNNYFGFSGIANFARYLAAPVLIAWVLFTFAKVSSTCPVSIFQASPTVSFPQALGLVSSFIIGYSVWGNEADYWRYGKPNKIKTAIPLVMSLILGQIIFPVTGWMMAYTSGVTGEAAAVNLMNQYVFGGISIVAAAVLTVSYFAVNDSSLYGTINGLQNLFASNRRKMVTVLAVLGAATAAALSFDAAGFEKLASLSSVILPGATVVMLVEYLGFARDPRNAQKFMTVVPLSDLPAINTIAVIALVFGYAVGLTTSGIIPGLEYFHVGICSLQSWIACGLLYFCLRFWSRSQEPGLAQTLKANSGDPSAASGIYQSCADSRKN
jgi:purine-cytosine permease-like protein